MPIDKDQLINEVRNRLDMLFPEPDLGWTDAVKIALCEACKECDPQCQLFANGVLGVDKGGLADGGEFLFDVTCLQYDCNGYQRGVPLVAECEWGGKARIYYDFEKLLLARADVRVLVFDGRFWSGAEDAENRFEVLARYINTSEQTVPGETFLLAAWMKGKFEYCRIDAFRFQGLLD